MIAAMPSRWRDQLLRAAGRGQCVLEVAKQCGDQFVVLPQLVDHASQLWLPCTDLRKELGVLALVVATQSQAEAVAVQQQFPPSSITFTPGRVPSVPQRATQYVVRVGQFAGPGDDPVVVLAVTHEFGSGNGSSRPPSGFDASMSDAARHRHATISSILTLLSFPTAFPTAGNAISSTAAPRRAASASTVT